MPPETAIDRALEELRPDLNPCGPLEEMFAAKIARFSVLSDNATDYLMRLNPIDQPRDYRRLAALINSYERIIKHAYTELRRLQAERASTPADAAGHATPANPVPLPRLARVALFTTPAGAPRKQPPARTAPPAASSALAA